MQSHSLEDGCTHTHTHTHTEVLLTSSVKGCLPVRNTSSKTSMCAIEQMMKEMKQFLWSTVCVCVCVCVGGGCRSLQLLDAFLLPSLFSSSPPVLSSSLPPSSPLFLLPTPPPPKLFPSSSSPPPLPPPSPSPVSLTSYIQKCNHLLKFSRDEIYVSPNKERYCQKCRKKVSLFNDRYQIFSLAGEWEKKPYNKKASKTLGKLKKAMHNLQMYRSGA